MDLDSGVDKNEDPGLKILPRLLEGASCKNLAFANSQLWLAANFIFFDSFKNHHSDKIFKYTQYSIVCPESYMKYSIIYQKKNNVATC